MEMMKAGGNEGVAAEAAPAAEVSAVETLPAEAVTTEGSPEGEVLTPEVMPEEGDKNRENVIDVDAELVSSEEKGPENPDVQNRDNEVESARFKELIEHQDDERLHAVRSSLGGIAVSGGSEMMAQAPKNSTEVSTQFKPCDRCRGGGRVWLGLLKCPKCKGSGKLAVGQTVTQKMFH